MYTGLLAVIIHLFFLIIVEYIAAIENTYPDTQTASALLIIPSWTNWVYVCFKMSSVRPELTNKTNISIVFFIYAVNAKGTYSIQKWHTSFWNPNNAYFSNQVLGEKENTLRGNMHTNTFSCLFCSRHLVQDESKLLSRKQEIS